MMTMKMTAQSEFQSVCHQHGALLLFLVHPLPSDDDEEAVLISFLVSRYLSIQDFFTRQLRHMMSTRIR